MFHKTRKHRNELEATKWKTITNICEWAKILGENVDQDFVKERRGKSEFAKISMKNWYSRRNENAFKVEILFIHIHTTTKIGTLLLKSKSSFFCEKLQGVLVTTWQWFITCLFLSRRWGVNSWTCLQFTAKTFTIECNRKLPFALSGDFS